VEFDNGFESVIGKLPFLDLDSHRNSGTVVLSELEKLKKNHTGVIELLSFDTI